MENDNIVYALASDIESLTSEGIKLKEGKKFCRIETTVMKESPAAIQIIKELVSAVRFVSPRSNGLNEAYHKAVEFLKQHPQ